MLIELDHVTRQFGEFKAVNNISFAIGQGEIIGLLGHNGAGKTTTMKLLTGYLEVTKGDIIVDGLYMGRDKSQIQERIGYLPENCPLWTNMSVIDFLRYQASIKNIAADKQEQNILSAITKTYLKEKALQPICTLSKGYRQRVGVANAILNQPKIIILDEPTNGLDPTQTMHMRSLIKELAKTSTVILSTHILQEVQAVCERVLIIRAGKLVTDQKLAELNRADGVTVIVDKDEEEMALLLNSIPAVRSFALKSHSNNHFRYFVDTDEVNIPLLSQAINQANFNLYELKPNIQSLEILFSQDFSSVEV